MVDAEVFFGKNIAYHLNFMGFQKCPDGIHCNFSGFLLGKTEHTCGNTAESDALHAALHRKFQTALIAAFQQFAVLFGQPALHDWSDGVYHIVAWQIVGRRDFRCTCRFFMPLCFHDLRTFQPQANPCKGMDKVINTIMTRMIASRHSRIRSIDNCTALQCGDIAFPEIDMLLNGLQIGNTCDAFLCRQSSQKFVLGFEILCTGFPCRTNVDKTAVKMELLRFICWKDQIIPFRMF